MSLIKYWKELFNSYSRFGYISEEEGTTRLSWSKEFMEAQFFLKDYAAKLGCETSIDGFGNLWITVQGKNSSLAPLYTGSHGDSVPNGGAYDGAFGILGPLACFASWKDEGFIPERTVQLISFAEEEGTRFGVCCLGSQAITGGLIDKSTTEYVTQDGITLEYLLKNAGLFGFPFKKKIDENARFIELHIEQGRILEDDGKNVGIVSSIVGIKRYEIIFEGEANHAGTTMMNQRKDALVAASIFINEVYKRALLHNRKYVATTGYIEGSPNAINVVPGKIVLSLELRSECESVMDEAVDAAKIILERIRQEYGVNTKLKLVGVLPTLKMDTDMMEILKYNAEKSGISYEIMPSWAGHDSMIMGKYIDVAMLFVPSIQGISHNPSEKTLDEDIYRGLSVFNGALKDLTKA